MHPERNRDKEPSAQNTRLGAIRGGLALALVGVSVASAYFGRSYDSKQSPRDYLEQIYKDSSGKISPGYQQDQDGRITFSVRPRPDCDLDFTVTPGGQEGEYNVSVLGQTSDTLPVNKDDSSPSAEELIDYTLDHC